MQTFLLTYLIYLSGAPGAESAGNIPNAFILTLISVTIVFLALICLISLYTLIGKVANIHLKRPNYQEQKGPTEKEAAAIAVALEMYMKEEMHDEESYVITIKRKG